MRDFDKTFKVGNRRLRVAWRVHPEYWALNSEFFCRGKSYQWVGGLLLQWW